MSSSQSPEPPMCFIHVHLPIDDKIGCSWYMVDNERGALLNTHASHAEAVKRDDAPHIARALCGVYPGIVGVVFVPCTNDHLTPAQKRLIHVN